MILAALELLAMHRIARGLERIANQQAAVNSAWLPIDDPAEPAITLEPDPPAADPPVFHYAAGWRLPPPRRRWWRRCSRWLLA